MSGKNIEGIAKCPANVGRNETHSYAMDRFAWMRNGRATSQPRVGTIILFPSCNLRCPNTTTVMSSCGQTIYMTLIGHSRDKRVKVWILCLRNNSGKAISPTSDPAEISEHNENMYRLSYEKKSTRNVLIASINVFFARSCSLFLPLSLCLPSGHLSSSQLPLVAKLITCKSILRTQCCAHVQVFATLIPDGNFSQTLTMGTST